MVNLFITSNLTGEVLHTYEGISEEEAEFLVEERENPIPCPPPCPLNGDCDSCIFFPHEFDDEDEPSPEVLADEEKLSQWINDNHDRLVAEWEEYAI